MRKSLSAIWLSSSALLGLAVFFAILWWAARSHSQMWRRVASLYPRPFRSGAAHKKLETIVIARRDAAGPATAIGGYRQYAGVILGLADDGLKLSIVPPLNVMCPPVELPFGAMTLRPTEWALWPDPFALRLEGLDDVEIVLAGDTVRWIRARTGAAPFGSS